MEFENFSIQEFLGILLIGFPVLLFFAFILLEFVAQIREFFEKEDTKNFFHHHFHYKDRR